MGWKGGGGDVPPLYTPLKLIEFRWFCRILKEVICIPRYTDGTQKAETCIDFDSYDFQYIRLYTICSALGQFAVGQFAVKKTEPYLT